MGSISDQFLANQAGISMQGPKDEVLRGPRPPKWCFGTTKLLLMMPEEPCGNRNQVENMLGTISQSRDIQSFSLCY